MGSTALEMMPTRVAPPFEVVGIGPLGADNAASDEVCVVRRAKDADLIRSLMSVLDMQLVNVLGSRSSAEFVEARKGTWFSYVRARRALSDTMANLISASELEMLSSSALIRIDADVDGSREPLLGDAVAEQMKFSMWIIGKMRALGNEISKAESPKKTGDCDLDLKLNEEFLLYSTWAQFHYDCVLAAMKFNKEVAPEVRDVIVDGLRAWVNACAIMEEALELRVAPPEYSEHPLPWDEEDEQLLASSMRDLDAESSGASH